MKKLIMFIMVIAIAVPLFSGIASAQPVCFTICPVNAGPGDEVTMRGYDEAGEFYDLSTLDAFESNFHGIGDPFYSLNCVGGNCENCEFRDGTVVFELIEDMLSEDVTEWDFFCLPGGDDAAFRIAGGDGPFETVAEAIEAGGTCGFIETDCGTPPPVLIDPNVMLVYETGETEGDFGVSLRNQPHAEGDQVTVKVDPNAGGPSEDITLIGGDPCDGSITLTFTGKTATDTNSLDLSRGSCADWNPATRTSCWNAPLTVAFKAIDDDIAEPPQLLEPQRALATSSYPAHPTDANFVGEKIINVEVMDNDQANILFTITPSEKDTPKTPIIGPVQIWEQPRYFWGSSYDKWRKIGVTLQVEPLNDDPCKVVGYVRVIVANEGESGNQPIMWLNPDWDIYGVPHQRIPEPNAIVFTSDGNPVSSGVIGDVSKWDVSYPILIFGNDDDVLQAEEVFAAGDENYGASLLFFVESTSDERYAPLNNENEPEGLERSVDLDIEDNECGAWGISYLDIVGDPSRVSDPNNPDCYVDIYDIIEFATRWFNCSDPQDAGCESYLD